MKKRKFIRIELNGSVAHLQMDYCKKRKKKKIKKKECESRNKLGASFIKGRKWVFLAWIVGIPSWQATRRRNRTYLSLAGRLTMPIRAPRLGVFLTNRNAHDSILHADRLFVLRYPLVCQSNRFDKDTSCLWRLWF